LALLQPIALSPDWGRQRRLWKDLQRLVSGPKMTKNEDRYA
jgi:hypothetical protein